MYQYKYRLRRVAALIMVSVVVLAGTGCTSAPRVLRDPSTGTTVHCGSRSEWTNWWGVANVRKERDCIAAYQRDGWRLAQ